MTPQPPRFAKRLLSWSLHGGDREAVVGDFAEEYEERCARHGLPAARAWYRRQVARSILPNVRRRRETSRRASREQRTPVKRLWLGGVMNDFRYALRSLRGSPGFTAVVLVVLTLGIGATTAIFSVVDAVVLRALPFDEHDRLVAVGERRPSAEPDPDPDRLSHVAPQNYMDWAAEQDVFESMAAIAGVGGGSVTLQEPDTAPEDLQVLRVTAGFFAVLRAWPAMGRPFTADHEIDGNHRVAILSDGLWRRRFGTRPDIVGRTIPLDGDSYEVIGVMPRGVSYPVGSPQPTEVWLPYVVPEDQRIRKPASYSLYLQVIARLKTGVSIEQAQAQMNQIAAAIEQANPDVTWLKGSGAGVRPLHVHLVGTPTRSWMLMLLGAVAVVLLIACANVANLLIARASMRGRDLVVRAALGASRWRLIRQSLCESLVLAAGGTVLAVVGGWWAVQVLRAALPEDVPRVATIALDVRVLALTAGLSLVAGLVLGILPALQGSKPDLAASLKDAARGASTSRTRQVARASLVIAEVALAVILLVGASLFIGSFVKLMRVDPGFEPDRVVTAFVAPPTTPRVFFSRIIERLEETPGVVSAAVVAGGAPLGPIAFGGSLRISPAASEEDSVPARYKIVTPDYHRVMGIPLRSGRLFESTDREGSGNIILISEKASSTYFADRDPVGSLVAFNGFERTIVGVVGDVRDRGLEAEIEPTVYMPMAQNFQPTGELVVRTSGSQEALPAIRAVLLDVMPTVPIRNIQTMEDVFAQHTAQRRVSMLLLGLFGVLGLAISAVGIYGVLAVVVSQRTREIGVRMALGATRANVVRMVLAQTGVLVACGLIIGGVGAWYLSATARAFLFDVEPTDPRAFAAAMVTLLLAALAASLIPARRAASVDPVVALRAE